MPLNYCRAVITNALDIQQGVMSGWEGWYLRGENWGK